jgi:hypothetical protein
MKICFHNHCMRKNIFIHGQGSGTRLPKEEAVYPVSGTILNHSEISSPGVRPLKLTHMIVNVFDSGHARACLRIR